jgi:hypothetical protein
MPARQKGAKGLKLRVSLETSDYGTFFASVVTPFCTITSRSTSPLAFL